MKVLSRGTPPPKYRWIGKWLCSECCSVVELDESDRAHILYTNDQRDGEFLSIPGGCPVCGTTYDSFHRYTGTKTQRCA